MNSWIKSASFNGRNKYEINNITYTRMEVLEMTNIKHTILNTRLRRGWTLYKTLTQNMRSWKSHKVKKEVQGTIDIRAIVSMPWRATK